MRMITGYLNPTQGSVAVCGYSLASEPISAKANIGYLPEGSPLYGDMTPAMFLRFVGQTRGMSGKYLQQRLDYVCEQLHLYNIWQQTIDTLSKGYKRRIGLAQAILHDPKVLILDEPTDGLDPLQKREIRALILGMAQEKAIVVSTHILEEVDAICNRVIIIANGRVVEEATPSELLARDRAANTVRMTIDRVDTADNIGQDLQQLSGVASVRASSWGSLMSLRPLRVPTLLTR